MKDCQTRRRNMIWLSVLLTSIAMCANAVEAHESAIGFDDLFGSRQVVSESTTERIAVTVDLQRLEQNRLRAEELTMKALELYGEIVKFACTDEIDRLGKRLRTWDKARWNDMVKSSSTLTSRLVELETIFIETEAVFTDASYARQSDLTRSIREIQGQFLRHLTIYNTIVRWADAREMRYDTALPFDQLRRSILDDRGLSPMPFAAGLRAPTRGTPAPRPTGEHGISACLQSIRELVSDSNETQRILSASAEKHRYARYSGESYRALFFNGSAREFEEDIKPLAIRYSMNLVQLKGRLNELQLLVSSTVDDPRDGTLRAQVKALRQRYDELVEWGDSWLLWYNAFGRRRRIIPIFPVQDFALVDVLN